MTSAIHPAPTEFSATQLSADPILRFFHYGHLPAQLQEISRPFCSMASMIVDNLPRNAERSTALRKLLEAKDAAVRANVEATVKPTTFLDRLKTEKIELQAKRVKLGEFTATDAFARLTRYQQTLLSQQLRAMDDYADILDARLLDLTPIPKVGEIRTTGGGSDETPVPFKG